MKKHLTILVTLLISQTQLFSQSSIGVWNFNTIAGTPANPIADIGNGTASVVGSLVVASAATGMDPIINSGCGAQNGVNPSAWALTANPGATDESSGVQFLSSTVGFQNIQFSWDQRWSNTATNTVRVQYTTDGASWNNFTLTEQNTRYCNGSINNGRFQNNGVGDQYRRISVNFASITAANNNANFGVRIVAAHYQATAQFRQTSVPATAATAGTWRFDNISFEGATNVSIPAASNFQVVNENVGTINIPVTTSNSNASAVTLNLTLSTYSNATENSDFSWTSTVVIPANTNGITQIPITITDDVLAEKAERIIVKINSGSNALISQTDNYQIIFIKDNDFVAPSPTNELNLNLLTSFSNGVAGSNSAEIISFDPSVDRLYIANSIGAKLDIVNFSNPGAPVLISSIPIGIYGNINSVTSHDSIIAMAIENILPQLNGKVVFLDYNGNFISQVEVGAMPDMITFNRNYTKILTANEGEPSSDYLQDPAGSVSIIDLSAGYPSLTNASATTIDLSVYNGQATALRALGIRIFSTSATVAQDLEPEYITISEDNTTAFVALQENNALLTINLATNSIVSLTALGYTSYGVGSNNALDASDQSGSVLITGDLPIKGAYMPDAIAYKTIGGQNYLFTANEGDSREITTVVDANRISSSVFNNVLDPTAFPDQNVLRNNKFLGRLSALKFSGDTDGDGDYDELHVMGGRSFSIWNAATGALVFDSKDLLEQITSTHPTFGAIFNASNTTGIPTLKNRSDDKGPEPEGITIHEFDGKTFAFIGLERIGGVMIFNVTNPVAPVYVGYQNNRSTAVSGPDLGSEGIITISAANSPNGQDIVILANEVSSTLSIYSMNTCAQISNTQLAVIDNIICPADTAQFSITSQANVSYQWLLNNQAIPSQTNSTLLTNSIGSYSVRVNNTVLNCIDTTAALAISFHNLPNVTLGNDIEACGGEQISIEANGASTFVWNNTTTDSTLTVVVSNATTSLSYSAIGTDSITGCSATDTVIVTVNSLPIVDAGTAISVCQNTSIVLNATGADSLVWTGSVTDETPFTQGIGSQTYFVTGVDANNCSAVDSVRVIVFSNPVALAGLDTSYCANAAPIVLTGNSNLTNIDFIWNATATSPQISVVTSGNYFLQAIDSNNCVGRDTVNIVFNTLPNVNLGNNQTICANNTPLVLSNVNPSVGAIFDWSTGAVTSTLNVTQSGTYNLEVIDTNGCLGIDSITITVNALPIVNLGNNQTICANTAPLVLSNSNVLVGAIFDWSTGAVTSTISVTQSGTFGLEVTDSNGCNGIDSVTVTVNALPIVNLGNNVSICPANLPLTLSNTSAIAGETFNWSTGSSTATTNVTQSGTYSLVVLNANGCSNSDILEMNVFSAPSISVGNDTTVCESQLPISLQATSSTANLNWSTGQNTSTIIINATGNYFVTATSTDGCSASDTISVNVATCAGLEDEAKITFSVYPNPANDNFNFATSEAAQFEIKLLNAAGQLVLREAFFGTEKQFDVSSLESGVYLIQINSDKVNKTIRLTLAK